MTLKGRLLGIIGWTVGIILAIGILGFAIFIGFALSSEDDEKSTQGEQEAAEESSVEEEQTEEEIEEEVHQVNETQIQSEQSFMDTLHKMTHQKIYANEKWGAVEITEERITLMLETVEASNFEHKEFYIDALSAWQEEDFSNAVEVHNYIWDEKNGNIGKATRLLSEEEEQRYIEKYFRRE